MRWKLPALALGIVLWVSAGCDQIGFRADPQYKQGESIQISDHINLKLVYWDISMDRLIAAFTVENTGSAEFLMRGTFSILHQQSGATDLAPLAFVAKPGPAQECASTLYGTVLPGETMGGTVCWENLHVNGVSFPLQLRYSLHTIDPLKKAVAVWTLQTHSIGETVLLNKTLSITVDRAGLLKDGDGLQLEYTIENQGANPVYFDSVFQIFRQRRFTADISADPAGQNGCDPALLGYVQPGQKLTATACWSGLKQAFPTAPFQVVFGPGSQGGEIVWIVDPRP